MVRRIAQLAVVGLVSLLGSACSHYMPLDAQGRTAVRVSIAPIVNQSQLAQMSAPLARNVREELASSRMVALASDDTSDAVLRLTIIEAQSATMARDASDTGRPISFLQTVQLRVEWISELPPPWGEDPTRYLMSEEILYPQPNLVDSRAQSIPRVSADLARQLRHLLENQQ